MVFVNDVAQPCKVGEECFELHGRESIVGELQCRRVVFEGEHHGEGIDGGVDIRLVSGMCC